jgi:hypothetical protein
MRDVVKGAEPGPRRSELSVGGDDSLRKGKQGPRALAARADRFGKVHREVYGQVSKAEQIQYWGRVDCGGFLLTTGVE